MPSQDNDSNSKEHPNKRIKVSHDKQKVPSVAATEPASLKRVHDESRIAHATNEATAQELREYYDRRVRPTILVL